MCINTFSSQYRDAGCAQENNLVPQAIRLLALIYVLIQNQKCSH